MLWSTFCAAGDFLVREQLSQLAVLVDVVALLGIGQSLKRHCVPRRTILTTLLPVVVILFTSKFEVMLVFP